MKITLKHQQLKKKKLTKSQLKLLYTSISSSKIIAIKPFFKRKPLLWAHSTKNCTVFLKIFQVKRNRTLEPKISQRYVIWTTNLGNICETISKFLATISPKNHNWFNIFELCKWNWNEVCQLKLKRIYMHFLNCKKILLKKLPKKML